MKTPKLHTAKILFFVLTFTLNFFTSYSQVGIGTISPDASSMLDVSSTSQGMLTPRMSTAQRLAISNPANGLLVYDLDERAFYFYEANTTSWVSLNSSQEKRNNYVLVKTLADFPAPDGSGVITLLSDHYYEINGLINLGTNTINLNNAYLSGLDANEDILEKAGGALFSGSTGGSINQLTLSGGGGSSSAFDISGATGQRLILLNSVVANFASVGTLSDLDLFFSNIVQYSGNATGITYSDIGKLLLSNQGWFSGNAGTFETITGSFDLIQKVSGFTTVDSLATGMDVSSNPTVGEGILLNVLFTGAGTYVNKYTTGTYPRFNFNNSWRVNSPGIPRESDDEAIGNIYFNGELATGFAQNIPAGQNVAFNLENNTTTLAIGNARMTSEANNRLNYKGRSVRAFLVNANVAVRANTSNTTNQFFSFFFRKNGTETLVPTNTVMRTPGSSGPGSDIINFSISGTVELAPGEYIEIWGQRLTGGTITSPQLAFFAVNMSVK